MRILSFGRHASGAREEEPEAHPKTGNRLTAEFCARRDAKSRDVHPDVGTETPTCPHQWSRTRKLCVPVVIQLHNIRAGLGVSPRCQLKEKVFLPGSAFPGCSFREMPLVAHTENISLLFCGLALVTWS